MKSGKYFLIAILLGLVGCTAERLNPPEGVDPPPVTTKKLAKVDSEPAAHVRIMELSGSPQEIGREHGKKLGGEIRTLYQTYLLPVIGDGPEKTGALMAAKYFETFMLPEHREEIAALSAACGVDEDETALAQCFLDLAPMSACSTIALPAGASPDGIGRMGRNLDFPSLDIADKHSVLLIYHPKGRYAFAAVGWPGLVGVLSGMNEKGLCLANMEVDRPARLPTAMPYMLLYRMLLERCATVDEAIDLLQKTPRQTANNLMLMDAQGNRAVAEITPEAVNVRRGIESAALISTNHQRGQDVDSTGRCWRYDRLHADAAAQFGSISLSAVETMLGRVTQGSHGDMTLQSMVFEPANRVIYLAPGEDAPARGYERIDLKNYFEKR